MASLLRPKRGDGEVLRGIAEGEAPAVGLRCCTAAGARAVAEGRLHEVGGAALELDAGMRAAGTEAEDVGHVSHERGERGGSSGPRRAAAASWQAPPPGRHAASVSFIQATGVHSASGPTRPTGSLTKPYLRSSTSYLEIYFNL